MFQSPYSTENEDNSSHNSYRAHTFPFYATLGEPLVYFADLRNTNNVGKKGDENKTPNCFVRAFRWYTRDLNQKRKVNVPQTSCQERNPKQEEIDFAKWLDDKYGEYLQEITLVQSKSKTVTLDYLNNTTSESQCQICTRRSRPNKKRLWNKRKRLNESENCKDCNAPVKFIMKPQCLSRPASECCRFPLETRVSHTKTTVYEKSQSFTGLQEVDRNIPVLDDKSITGSNEGSLQKKKLGTKIAQVETTHLEVKEVDVQNSCQIKKDKTAQCGTSNVECSECVHKFIKTVAEEPLSNMMKRPEPGDQDKNSKFISSSAQVTNIPLTVNVECQCKIYEKKNSTEIDCSNYPNTTIGQSFVKKQDCNCLFENPKTILENQHANTIKRQISNKNNKSAIQEQSLNNECSCFNKLRGENQIPVAAVTFDPKEEVSPTTEDCKCPPPNLCFNQGLGNEPSLRNQICFPVTIKNENGTTSAAETQYCQLNNLLNFSEGASQKTNTGSEEKKANETSVQTSDHSIIFRPDYPLYMKISCVNKLNDKKKCDCDDMNK